MSLNELSFAVVAANPMQWMKNEQIVEALLSAEWQAVVADWHGVLAGDAGERCMSKKLIAGPSRCHVLR